MRRNAPTGGCFDCTHLARGHGGAQRATPQVGELSTGVCQAPSSAEGSELGFLQGNLQDLGLVV